MMSFAIRPFLSVTKNETATPFFPARPVRPIRLSNENSRRKEKE